MKPDAEDSVRFVPSAVKGLPSVTEAAVFPDRLELMSEGKSVVIRFLDIARWYRRGWFYRPLARLGLGVRAGHPSRIVIGSTRRRADSSGSTRNRR